MSNDIPAVSVIIPVYNAAEFLKDGLNSLLKQTLREIEIICVDDGSTDGSLVILKEFEKADARIRVIHQENQGAGAARNNGMDVARGKYLAFLDADDFFEKNMLKAAYDRAEETEAEVCVFNADLYDHTEKVYKKCTWAFRKQYFPEKEKNSHNIQRETAEVRDTERLVLILDASYYYDEKGYLRALDSVNNEKSQVRNLFHQLNQAKEKIALIVKNNETVYKNMLELLQSKDKIKK